MLLLAIMGLPLATPLLAMGTTSDASLPRCCRRAGQHRCAMDAGVRQTPLDSHRGLQAVREKCPYAPHAFVAAHIDPSSVPLRLSDDAPVKSDAARITQMESKWRIARDRSRGKRGPPASSLT